MGVNNDKKWGGSRSGAGRPPIRDRVVKVIKMPASYAKKVDYYAEASGMGSFSAVIRALVENMPEPDTDDGAK